MDRNIIVTHKHPMLFFHTLSHINTLYHPQLTHHIHTPQHSNTTFILTNTLFLSSSPSIAISQMVHPRARGGGFLFGGRSLTNQMGTYEISGKLVDCFPFHQFVFLAKMLFLELYKRTKPPQYTPLHR